MHFFSASDSANILLPVLLIVLAVGAWGDSDSKTLPKRSLIPDESLPWAGAKSPQFFNGGRWNPGFNDWNGGHKPLGYGPSPGEVANAISSAKQAAVNVLIAQRHLNVAKENVLNQQRIATEKQTQAVILKQKSQAAATIQRSEAIQQRLAASKAAVAHAAAHAAAAEIQQNERDAVRLGHFTRHSNPGAGQALLSAELVNHNPSGAHFGSIGFGQWLAGNGKPIVGWY